MPKVKPNNPRDTNDAFMHIGEALITSSKTPNILGYSPHQKQNDFHSFGRIQGYRGVNAGLLGGPRISIKEVLRHVRLYIGGNRSGKTVGGVCEDIWWVTKTHPYIDIDAIWPEPIHGRVVTTDYEYGWEKIIYPQFQRWTPLTYLRGNSWSEAWDKETHTIYFSDRLDPAGNGRIIRGGWIEIKTHKQDLETFAGTSRHFIHFDEECAQEIYTECMARLIDTGGCAWLTMTPLDGMTWTFDEIYDPADEANNNLPNIHVTEVDLYENPYLSDEERESFIALLGKDDIEARVHGKFVRKGGLIYPEFNPAIHVIEPYHPPKDYVWVASLDHGLNNATAWLWHAINYEGRVITFKEHYQRNWVISQHAKEVHETNTFFGKEPDYYVGDPSIGNRLPNTGVSIFEEYTKYGIIIRHGQELNDVKAGIERIKRYLRTADYEADGTRVPYWLITSNCEKLIWELKRYRWRTYVSRQAEANNNPQEQPVKKDDHAVDSCRYFFMSHVDLKTEKPNQDSEWQLNEIIPTTKVRIAERDFDEEFIEKNGWKVSEYAGGEETNWEVEEFIGGDW